MNKHENNSFFDFFNPIFKKKQINEMKRILFKSNLNEDKNLKVKSNKNKVKKGNSSEKHYLNFTVIIEEKEDNEIYCKLLKMKLSFILLTHINNKVYLNGTYMLDNDIIITEQTKSDEIVLYFGNKEQKNYIPKENKEYDNKNIFIRKKRNEKYLGDKKLMKIYNYLGCKKYNVYHFLLSNKKKINEGYNKNKEQLEDNFEDDNSDIDNNNNNNNVFAYNDLASQTSSTTSSISTNNIINYERGNKKAENTKNIIKELNLFKYILFLTFILFLLILIIEFLLLINYYNKMSFYNDFYLVFQNFCGTYYSLFFSVLSLGCIAKSPETEECRQYMGEVIDLVIDKFFKESINNNDMNEETLKSHFIDFVELIFYQSQILSDNLNDLYNNISLLITKFNDDKINQFFENILIHYKINQNLTDNF